MMTDNHVRFQVADGVATITLDRPDKLNASTPQMSAQLLELVRLVDDDDAIRVLVFTGTGRAFSVGSDIGELDRYPSHWSFRNRRDYCDALRSLRKPVIGAINGYAYGGGLELALSCDVRIAAENATFAAAEVKLGWVGGGGVAALLMSSVALTDAALMLLTGDPIDAAEALRIGLVSRVVAADALGSTAQALAAIMSSRPPIALQSAKADLRAALSMPLEQAVQYEREMQTICMATADAAEGRSAFSEKRPPVFRGE